MGIINPAKFNSTSDESAGASPPILAGKIGELESNIGRVIKGKPEAVRLAVVALLAGGHLLIEDVPGIGKTTLAHALARSLEGTFARIQFTSDLLPSDVTGLSVYNERTREFEFMPGAIFSNVVLADEINRTSPKTQSALLEAMAEGHVTIEGTTHPLPRPFVVVATQNPTEHHGTFPLPESQLDRFMLRLTMGYPDIEFERQILRDRFDHDPLDTLEPCMNEAEVLELQKLAGTIRVDDGIIDYLLRIVHATREAETLDLGVSPRGTLSLFRAAQALALVEGRAFCLPDDIKRLAAPVFAHRLIVNRRFASVNRTGDAAIALEDILKSVAVPV